VRVDDNGHFYPESAERVRREIAANRVTDAYLWGHRADGNG